MWWRVREVRFGCGILTPRLAQAPKEAWRLRHTQKQTNRTRGSPWERKENGVWEYGTCHAHIESRHGRSATQRKRSQPFVFPSAKRINTVHHGISRRGRRESVSLPIVQWYTGLTDSVHIHSRAGGERDPENETGSDSAHRHSTKRRGYVVSRPRRSAC